MLYEGHQSIINLVPTELRSRSRLNELSYQHTHEPAGPVNDLANSRLSARNITLGPGVQDSIDQQAQDKLDVEFGESKLEATPNFRVGAKNRRRSASKAAHPAPGLTALSYSSKESIKSSAYNNIIKMMKSIEHYGTQLEREEENLLRINQCNPD